MPRSQRILICGSRGWKDAAAIRRVVKELPPDTIVIHGGAAGADSWAARFARARNLHTAVLHPLWGIRGDRAGFDRNCAMLDLAPHRVIAFWDGKSPGTKGTIDEAERRGIPVEIVGTVAEQEPVS